MEGIKLGTNGLLMKYFTFIFLLSTATMLQAQAGGEEVFAFLNMPTSARQSALGGSTLTLMDDVNQPLWNPATITPEMDGLLSLNYVNYLLDVNYVSASYAYHVNDHFGTVHSGLTYLNYGKFIAADEDGTETGSFKAFDMALSLGYSYQIPRTDIYMGANAKLIHSSIEEYSSIGIATDIGFMYHSEYQPFTIALVIRNAGFQLKSYDRMKEKLPLQIQAGWSYQLEHVPIRIYTTFDNLQKWQLAYANPSDNTEDLETGETIVNKPTFLNNAMRHVVIGAELFPEKGFSIRTGFNFQRAQELGIEGSRTFAGLTFGFGLKMRKLKLNYAFSKYHPVSDSHTFNLGIDLN